jgi:predicted amino acid racemase
LLRALSFRTRRESGSAAQLERASAIHLKRLLTGSATSARSIAEGFPHGEAFETIVGDALAQAKG